MTHAQASPMLAQLLFQIASQLDNVLELSESSEECPSCLCNSARDDISDCWDARSVDRECMLHVAAAKRLTRQFKYCSLTMDKADIRSQSMQNAGCILPTNVGFALIPQVADFPTNGQDHTQYHLRQARPSM